MSVKWATVGISMIGNVWKLHIQNKIAPTKYLRIIHPYSRQLSVTFGARMGNFSDRKISLIEVINWVCLCCWGRKATLIRRECDHDDVIKWKHFRVTGPLCGKFTGHGEFPSQRPVTRSFDVFFDLRGNKRLRKQSWGWWFETQSRSLWRHCNAFNPYSDTSLTIYTYLQIFCDI